MTVTTGPVMGEPLPIELANATYAIRGHPQDGLRTVEQLAFWLEQVRPRLPLPPSDADLRDIGPQDLVMARELRDAIRTLAAAAVERTPPPAAALDSLNRCVRTALSWRELRWDDGTSAEPRNDARPITATLSGIAELAVDLFAGPALADLRACHAPGCVLFFIKDHPRRAWCSPGCGNRARAARHYRRTKA
ncbi:CGNR zinc finger domain-containing protein [Streptomyces albicerus]|uniref:CGNR zinc finger domain-containing protein n=1 Tax=Streptomyces albicerus TaxID=2569859 RepID=UPI001CEDF86B|nr:CGNR zinc finger domain-containing protein [Streptomyces albicerus]